jgi:hypothetical protein
VPPRLASILCVLALLGCRHCTKSGTVSGKSSVATFLSSDSPPVTVGRYSGQLRILPQGHAVSLKAEPLRQDALSHESILRRLVREHIEVKDPLEFRFMYTGHDSLSREVVLRFFARKPVPTDIAGWQVMLVYSEPSLVLLRVCVSEVPLE